MRARFSKSSTHAVRTWIFAGVLGLGACGEHTTINQYYYSEVGGAAGSANSKTNELGGRTSGIAGEASDAAGQSGAPARTNGTAGEPSGGASGEAGQASESGAATGQAGQSGASGAAGETGEAGAAGQSLCAGAAQGSLLIPDEPADCHAVTCDGLGHEVRVVYQNNVPKSNEACGIATCDRNGNVGIEPAPMGTPCRAAGGAIVCDGSGVCVECLHTSDCPSGLSCSATERCVSAPCTDVDCGGACPPCADGKQCLVDSDCAGYACDTATLTCMSNQCADHQQDGNETDADCGGGTCAPCAFGKSCKLSSDCVTFACDGISLVCVEDACSDRRQDGAESDIDCGGGSCASCGVGRRCKSNFDCISGHFCNSASPRVCQ